MPTVFDFYAGAGGLSLGAERAGFHVISAIELDRNAIASHKTNFPNTIHIQKDIMELTGEDILKLSNVEHVTGIIGGPPCQGFSTIGQGNVNDSRNSLFIKFFELVCQIKPTFFVAENVPGIMNSKYDEIRNKAFDQVKSENYIVLPPLCVIASDFGAATSRKRYFFIGYRADSNLSLSLQDFENAKVLHKTTVKMALEGLPENLHYSKAGSGFRKLTTSYYVRDTNHIQNDFFYNRITGNIPHGVGNAEYVAAYNRKHIVNGELTTKHSPEVRKRYSELDFGKQDKVSKSTRLNPDGLCPTLRAGTGPDKGSYQAVRPIHYKYPRVITPREAARLQGFPDWYKLPDTIWHAFRQIGNSVSPIVAEQILSIIYQNLT